MTTCTASKHIPHPPVTYFYCKSFSIAFVIVGTLSWCYLSLPSRQPLFQYTKIPQVLLTISGTPVFRINRGKQHIIRYSARKPLLCHQPNTGHYKYDEQKHPSQCSSYHQLNIEFRYLWNVRIINVNMWWCYLFAIIKKSRFHNKQFKLIKCKQLADGLVLVTWYFKRLTVWCSNSSNLVPGFPGGTMYFGPMCPYGSALSIEILGTSCLSAGTLLWHPASLLIISLQSVQALHPDNEHSLTHALHIEVHGRGPGAIAR